MTDRIKGFLVTFEKDVRDDQIELIRNAIGHIRNVQSVKPYVSGLEDHMLYERAISEIGQKLLKFVRKECFGIKDEN
jgi:hypothetical protein